MGGGGSSQTTTAAIDPDIKAAVLPALDYVTQQFSSQTESGGAPIAGRQGVDIALGEQEKLAREVLNGGLNQQIESDLRNFSGQQQAGSQGNLGSSRQARANAAGLADRSLALRQAELGAKEGAARGLTDTAMTSRGIDQEVLDAPHKAAQRYFGYLGSAPGNTTQTTSGGGGK